MLLARGGTGMMSTALPARAATAPTTRLAVPRPQDHASTSQRAPASARPSCRSGRQPSHGSRPASHTCRAATQLATYDLLSTKSLSTVWFQSCVQKLIGKLGSAPLLHIVHSLPLQQEETVALSNDLLQSPQAWSSLSARLAAADPDALVFVHSVDCAEDVCPAHKATRQRACSSPSSCSSNMAAAAAASSSSVMAGSVEDSCCAQESTSQSSQSSTSQPQNTALAQVHPVLGLAQRPAAVNAVQRQQQQGGYPEQQEQYHGVVIQSPVFKDIEGCYLLKTVTAADRTGCRCTHFTLTKVCAGVPLLTQLQRSWLVGPVS